MDVDELSLGIQTIQFWFTILGAFFGALFGVMIPLFCSEIKNEIAIRKAIKAELLYNIDRLNKLAVLIGVSGIPSEIATRLSSGQPINLGSSVAFVPFSLEIGSSRVYNEKWVEISKLREIFIRRIKFYYEDLVELQKLLDYTIDRCKSGNFDNDNTFKYIFDTQTKLLSESKNILSEFHELHCFGFFNTIWQKMFLK